MVSFNRFSRAAGADPPSTKKAIVVGAGPGGILTAINLMKRGTYSVTLVDPGRDYSKVVDLSTHRSWMIGLATHGISSLREVDGLWDYVEKVGVKLDSFSIFLGQKEMRQTTDDAAIPKAAMKEGMSQEGFLVDRNYVVAAEAQYLADTFGDDPNYKPKYGHRLLYVDDRQRRVLIRNDETNCEEYLEYDVLIGADGVRSVVRNAIQVNHRDFECRVDDIFATFKAVHVKLPPKVGPGTLTLLPNSMPNMNGIALPEKGGMICMTFGHNLDKPCDDEMMSSDPKVVAKYVKEKFQAYELVDYEDFADQWCNQSWNTTGQVHCNFYHSNKLQCLILGDAAHATSPSIGMGMNTALSDASCLNRLLDKHGDDSWDEVRPSFSHERVKEGQSLTDLAYYLFSFDTKQQLRFLLAGAIRTAIWKRFPSLVNPDPQVLIGCGYKLSEVYAAAKSMGIIDAVHATNDIARREYWEKRWGMIQEEKVKGGISAKVLLLAVLCAGLAFSVYVYQQQTPFPTTILS